MSLERISEQNLEEARKRYFGYQTISQIAKDLGVSRAALQYHVKQKWKAERTLLESEIISEFAGQRVTALNTISKTTVEIMLKSLENLKNRKKAPTLMEAKAASAIFESLDKIMRLDKGTPTDIIGETKPSTIIELKERFRRVDPFNRETEDEVLEINDSEPLLISNDSNDTGDS